jgi:hypothetical protein
VVPLPSETGLAAIDCGPVKPGTTTDTSIEDNLKGHAQVILQSLGSGEIENGYKQTEADTLSKYPNADQLVLGRSYIYITCSLLQYTSQGSDDQKFERLIQHIKLYNQPRSIPRPDWWCSLGARPLSRVAQRTGSSSICEP